ncbi:DUF1295 domain-containing protein [Amorphus coralli]|uniref:DUF1295 domain-containing protein n=1 Tax=Amorphus coralli TaxID=340680 RepID=UPI00036B2588|nr:DUF1295 domain-containing protein [Amorphus coralli]
MNAPPLLILISTFALACVLFTIVWRIHVAIRDASIIDYVWAPGFVALAIATLALSGPPNGLQIAFLAALVAWAARLTIHLVRRHRRAGVEDGRYERFRQAGGAAYWWKSLFTVFLLQAFLQWLIAFPVLTSLSASHEPVSTALALVGLAVFAAGFGLEWVADNQLKRHKADPANHARTLDSGLWAWSRHPNYFGEIVLWWGLALTAYALSGSLWAFLGPIVLTVVVRTVSLRLTEDHAAASRPDFAAYRARTSALLPRPPKPAATAAEPVAPGAG